VFHILTVMLQSAKTGSTLGACGVARKEEAKVVYECLSWPSQKSRRYNRNQNARYHINLYRCTVRYGICILFTHQQMHFLLNLEKF